MVMCTKGLLSASRTRSVMRQERTLTAGRRADLWANVGCRPKADIQDVRITDGGPSSRGGRDRQAANQAGRDGSRRRSDWERVSAGWPLAPLRGRRLRSRTIHRRGDVGRRPLQYGSSFRRTGAMMRSEGSTVSRVTILMGLPPLETM